MQSKATNVEDYLASLPPERREVVEKIRAAINRRLPKGFAEGMQYGMIGWFVPHSVFPDGYHCDPRQPLPFVSVASQKNYVSLYLFCIYMSEADQRWFASEWKKTGAKLDMGKSCVRVKKFDDLPYDLIGEAIARWPVEEYIARYQASLAGSRSASRKKASNKASDKGAAPKTKAAKRSASQETRMKNASTTKKAAGKKASAKKAKAAKPAAKQAVAKKTTTRKAAAKKAPAKKKAAKKRATKKAAVAAPVAEKTASKKPVAKKKAAKRAAKKATAVKAAPRKKAKRRKVATKA